MIDQIADRIAPERAAPATIALTASEQNPELLGPRDPVSGLRRGQDIGDAVLERILGG